MKKSNGEKFMSEFENIDDIFLNEAINYTQKKVRFKSIIAVAACAVFALAAIPVAKRFADNDIVDTNTTTSAESNATSASTATSASSIATSNTSVTTIGATAEPLKVSVNGNFSVLQMLDYTESYRFESQNHKNEIDLTGSSVVDEEKLGTNVTVEFDGNEYTATYTKTVNKYYYSNPMYLYNAKIDGKTLFIHIDSVTEKCVYLMLPTSVYPDSGTELTRDECFAIAREHFENGGYIEDPENYQITYEHYYGAAKAGYRFGFSRFINGVKTDDMIIISVNGYGDLTGYDIQKLGLCKNINISEIDTEAVESSIDTKINSIYGDKYVFSEMKNDITFTRLADGSFALLCKVEFKASPIDEDFTRNQTCDFCVKIG